MRKTLGGGIFWDMTYHDIPINDKTVLLVLSCFRIWVFSVSHSPQAIPGGGNPFRKTRRHVVWTARGRKQRKFHSKPKQNYCTKTISQKVFQVTFLVELVEFTHHDCICRRIAMKITRYRKRHFGGSPTSTQIQILSETPAWCFS